jgi:hypothetical protein
VHFREAEGTKLRLPEIGQAEEGVAVLIQFGGEPDPLTERIEEFDHRHMVDVA